MSRYQGPGTKVVSLPILDSCFANTFSMSSQSSDITIKMPTVFGALM